MILAYKFELESKLPPDQQNTHTASTIDHPDDTLIIHEHKLNKDDFSVPGVKIEYMNIYSRMSAAPYRKAYIHLDAALDYTRECYRRAVAFNSQGDVRVCIMLNGKLVGKAVLDRDDTHVFHAILDWRNNQDVYDMFAALRTPGSVVGPLTIKVFLDKVIPRVTMKGEPNNDN